MMGMDTNVIIRYLVQDDPLQAAIATKFVDQTINRRKSGTGLERAAGLGCIRC